MNDNLTEQIMQRLDALAAKLGTTGEYLWAVLVTQGYVRAWAYLVGLLFGWAVVVALWRITRKVWGRCAEVNAKRGLARIAPDDGWIGPMVAACAVSLLVAILTACALPPIFTGFLNPEYAALREVLDALK